MPKTKEDLAATVARADYKEGNPESEVRRLARRFGHPFELAKQNPGDGAIYKLEHEGRTLVRAKGRKAFVSQLHAFEEGLQFAFSVIRRSYFGDVEARTVTENGRVVGGHGGEVKP